MTDRSSACIRDSLLPTDEVSVTLTAAQLSHLVSCAECAAYVQDEIAAWAGVLDLPDTEPPVEMTERLFARLPESPGAGDLTGAAPRRGEPASDRRRSRPSWIPGGNGGVSRRLLRDQLRAAAPFLASVVLLIGYDRFSRGRYADETLRLHELNGAIAQQRASQESFRDGSTQLFETLTDKFEALAREVDALAGALKSSQESALAPKALEGPDSLDTFGLDDPVAAPPPQEELGTSSFLEGREGPGEPSGRYRGSEAPLKRRLQPDWVQAVPGAKLPHHRVQADDGASAHEDEPPHDPAYLVNPDPSPTPGPSPVGEESSPPMPVDDAAAAAPEGEEAKRSAGDEHPPAPSEGGASESSLDTIDAVEGIAFRPASGMWESGYSPPAEVDAQTQHPETIAELIRHPSPPATVSLEPPDDDALAFGARQSRQSAEGPTRVRVGLELASARLTAAHRPDLSITVALDLSGAPGSSARAGLWRAAQQLRMSLVRSDRMRLLINRCSSEEPEIYEPDQVTYGLLTQLEAEDATCPQGSVTPSYLLSSAVNRISDVHGTELREASDQPAPTEVAVLLTSVDRLTEAEQEAISVTALSVAPDRVRFVIPIEGFRPDRTPLVPAFARIRSVLHPLAAGAEQIVETILRTGSEVAAQAVELRVRLAPGVKLVDVVGSHPLSADETERQSAQRRALVRGLRRSAGIREQPEEIGGSLTFSIPFFYSADAHAIVLDLVAPGPGAVLSARLRYKDLLNVRNGEQSISVSLTGDAEAARRDDPELVRSIVRLRLAELFNIAAAGVESGDRNVALSTLDRAASLLQAAAERHVDLRSTSWSGELIERYQSLVRELPPLSSGVTPVSDSLRLAARTLSGWSAV